MVMTEREQLQNVCQWNRELARENTRLREKLDQAEHSDGELRSTNASLQAELSAADALLGAAIDEALQARQL
jgi:hypothetical protein